MADNSGLKWSGLVTDLLGIAFIVVMAVTFGVLPPTGAVLSRLPLWRWGGSLFGGVSMAPAAAP